MFALFEEAGKFQAGRVMSEAEASAQIELDSGKRVKVKAANVLLKFEKPAPADLVRAAQAGAAVDLVVRGACVLPPGIPGVTERIRVRSVVGRFLEHTRVVYFRWGEGEDDEVLYLSSADWMGRNMFRRIEVAWPVRDAALRQRVIDEGLVPYLHDQRDAWELDAEGREVGRGEHAQHALDLLRRAGVDADQARSGLVATDGEDVAAGEGGFQHGGGEGVDMAVDIAPAGRSAARS